MPGQRVALHLAHSEMNLEHLLRQRQHHLGGLSGHIWRLTFGDATRHQQSTLKPFWNIDSKLGEQSPDHVHELGALLDHEIARAVQ